MGILIFIACFRVHRVSGYGQVHQAYLLSTRVVYFRAVKSYDEDTSTTDKSETARRAPTVNQVNFEKIPGKTPGRTIWVSAGGHASLSNLSSCKYSGDDYWKFRYGICKFRIFQYERVLMESKFWGRQKNMRWGGDDKIYGDGFK